MAFPSRPHAPELEDEANSRDPKAYVEPDVWKRQIALLVRDHPFDTVMAERLFCQAVAYLITAMEKWGQHLEIGCGELVDTAVHAFILIRARLVPGGKLVFSHAPAVPGSYGRQGIYGNGLTGKQVWVYRWAYESATWAGLLHRHGFTDIHARVEAAPRPDHVGTLIVECRRAGEE